MQKADLLDYQKAELRITPPSQRTAYMARIDLGRKLKVANEKYIAFHNLFVKKRILLAPHLKAAYAEVDDIMAQIINNMAIAADGGEPKLRYEAHMLFRQLNEKTRLLEKAIAAAIEKTA